MSEERSSTFLFLKNSCQIFLSSSCLVINNCIRNIALIILFRFLSHHIYILSKLTCSGEQLPQLGLMTPYGDRDLGSKLGQVMLGACRHQAIADINVALSSVRSSHLRAISQEIPQPSMTKISLKNDSSKI